MKQYIFLIQEIREDIDANVERFNELGAEGWRAVGKFSLNHMLFEREFDKALEYHVFHDASRRSA